MKRPIIIHKAAQIRLAEIWDCKQQELLSIATTVSKIPVNLPALHRHCGHSEARCKACFR
jgi:hypothetical protein